MANEPQPRAAAHTSPTGTASCATCHRWRTEERRAEAVQDHSRATDCRVMFQRHRAAAHGGSE